MTNARLMSLGDRDRGAFLGIFIGGADAAGEGWASPHGAVTIDIVAYPWSGTMDGTFSGDEFRTFAAALRSRETPRRAVLGGGRSREIELKLTRQSWPTTGEALYAIEARAAWTGDDPYPELRWLMFDVPQSQLEAAADAFDATAGA